MWLPLGVHAALCIVVYVSKSKFGWTYYTYYLGMLLSLSSLQSHCMASNPVLFGEGTVFLQIISRHGDRSPSLHPQPDCHCCWRGTVEVQTEKMIFLVFTYMFWYNNGDCWWRTGAELVKKHDEGKIVKRGFILSSDIYFMCIWCLCWSPDAIFMVILYFLVFIWTGDACWTECF